MWFGTSQKFVFKILILGDTGVGKTSLVIRAVKGYFPDPETLKSTIGAAFFTMRYKIQRDLITAQIWDFAGQERFRSFMKNMFTGSSGGLFVFDLTNTLSLDDLKNFWIPEIIKRIRSDFFDVFKHNFILVGNKKDLKSQIEVTKEEITKLVRQYGFKYFSASAKTGDNVSTIFKELIRMLYISPYKVI